MAAHRPSPPKQPEKPHLSVPHQSRIFACLRILWPINFAMQVHEILQRLVVFHRVEAEVVAYILLLLIA